MPLILALEPDRRQASRVGALKRRLVGAELIVTDSTDRAIAALAGRKPDLILTSLLLSPKEEARLGELSGPGAHVQTLMIPVLASGTGGSASRGGLFTRLRGARTEGSVADGCDPSVFAAQIAEYLENARTERETADAIRDLEVEQRPGVAEPTCEVTSEPELMAESQSDLTAQFEASLEAESSLQADVSVEAPSALEAEAALEIEAALEAAAVVEVETIPEVEMAPEAAVTSNAVRMSPSKTPGDDVWEDFVVDQDLEDALAAIELTGETIDLQSFVTELEAAAAESPVPSEARAAEIVSNNVVAPEPRGTIGHALASGVAWPPLKGTAVAGADTAATSLIEEFMTALDETLDEPDGGEADSDLWMPLPNTLQSSWPRLQVSGAETESAGRSTGSSTPVQDEWGFFDPNQCGFNALLAKLQEITK